MKTIRNAAAIALLISAALFFHCSKEAIEPFKVMSYNIRLDVKSDGENAWPHRAEKVASTLRFHRADLIGLQEALKHQVQELADQLPMYEHIGVGRDDGLEAGEYMAVFYLKSRFTLLDHGTFWLSETIDKPSKGWDAACHRTVTWARFQDRASGQSFYHFNTHFDHQGETARLESARLLLDSVIKIAGEAPVIVTGDFNVTSDNMVYRILTGSGTDSTVFKLHNAEDVSVFAHHGPATTFNGFDFDRLRGNPAVIDYIFVTSKVHVLNHGILTDTWNGRFASDHFPVLAEIRLP